MDQTTARNHVYQTPVYARPTELLADLICNPAWIQHEIMLVPVAPCFKYQESVLRTTPASHGTSKLVHHSLLTAYYLAGYRYTYHDLPRYLTHWRAEYLVPRPLASISKSPAYSYLTKQFVARGTLGAQLTSTPRSPLTLVAPSQTQLTSARREGPKYHDSRDCGKRHATPDSLLVHVRNTRQQCGGQRMASATTVLFRHYSIYPQHL